MPTPQIHESGEAFLVDGIGAAVFEEGFLFRKGVDVGACFVVGWFAVVGVR